jgi:Uma2 family endonuclease
MVASTALTDAELIELSISNPGWRVERRAGALVMTPPTGTYTGVRNNELAVALAPFAQAHSLVGVDSSGGVRLPDGDAVSADDAFLRASDWNALDPPEREGIASIVPVVVIELVSKSDRHRTTAEKCEHWFEQGVALVIMLDPYRRTIRAWGDVPPDFPDLLAAVQ